MKNPVREDEDDAALIAEYFIGRCRICGNVGHKASICK